MVRVTKPGGRIVMGNWIPTIPPFVSQLLKISSAFTPPPPEGFVSPMTWGVEDHVVERFGQAGVPSGKALDGQEHLSVHVSDKSPEQFIDVFRRFYGPTMNAFEAARANGREDELHGRLLELAKSQNKGEAGGTTLDATFLRVTASL